MKYEKKAGGGSREQEKRRQKKVKKQKKNIIKIKIMKLHLCKKSRRIKELIICRSK